MNRRKSIRMLRKARLSRVPEERLQILQQALHLARRGGDDKLISQVYEALGDFFYDQARRSEAEDAYRDAMFRLSERSGRVTYVRTRLVLKVGHCLYDRGDFVGALRHYQEAYEAGTPSRKDHGLPGQISRNLGNTCCRLGLFSQAVNHYRESKRVSLREANMVAVAHAELGLSYALRSLRAAEEAISSAKEAERIYEAEGDQLGVLSARHNRAVAAIDLGRLEEAKAWLDDALDYYREHGLPEFQAAALEEMARLLQAEGKLHSALDACLEGLSLLEGHVASVAFYKLKAQLGLVEAVMENPDSAVHLREAAAGFAELSQAHEVARLLDRFLAQSFDNGGIGR